MFVLLHYLRPSEMIWVVNYIVYKGTVQNNLTKGHDLLGQVVALEGYQSHDTPKVLGITRFAYQSRERTGFGTITRIV